MCTTSRGDDVTLTQQQKDMILKFLTSSAKQNNLVKEVTEKK